MLPQMAPPVRHYPQSSHILVKHPTNNKIINLTYGRHRPIVQQSAKGIESTISFADSLTLDSLLRVSDSKNMNMWLFKLISSHYWWRKKMNKVLYIILISLFSLTVISCSSSSDGGSSTTSTTTTDTTAPVISEVTVVTLLPVTLHLITLSHQPKLEL